jgi:hypothetical protein
MVFSQQQKILNSKRFQHENDERMDDQCVCMTLGSMMNMRLATRFQHDKYVFMT